MKLAEALLIRSDMQIKLAQLKRRIHNNVKVQEGDTPSEDPNTLMLESSQIISELSRFIECIHRTNSIAMITTRDKEQSMLSLLGERDTLKMRHKLLTDMIEATHTEEDRYSLREIKWQVIVSVSSLQKQADDLAVKLRQVNLVIQANNWQIDLLE